MAPFQFTVTMQTQWRGQAEEFSNVFHYDIDVSDQGNERLELVLDAIVNNMRPIFGSEVTFVRGRVNGPTNQGAAADTMRVIKDYSGAGTRAPTSGGTIGKESAVVVSMYVGRNPATGRKRFLRKFLHVGVINSQSDPVRLGSSQLPASEITFFEDWFESMKNLTIPPDVAVPIVTPQGDGLPLNTEAVCLPYLHTRQLKQ